jgi:cyclic beta-1,2-glucan synthetase
MIWNGYTGAAGWMFRQALEGVLGLRLVNGRIVPPPAIAPPVEPRLIRVSRDTMKSPLDGPPILRSPAQIIEVEPSVPLGF